MSKTASIFTFEKISGASETRLPVGLQFQKNIMKNLGLTKSLHTTK